MALGDSLKKTLPIELVAGAASSILPASRVVSKIALASWVMFFPQSMYNVHVIYFYDPQIWTVTHLFDPRCDTR